MFCFFFFLDFDQLEWSSALKNKQAKKEKSKTNPLPRFIFQLILKPAEKFFNHFCVNEY